MTLSILNDLGNGKEYTVHTNDNNYITFKRDEEVKTVKVKTCKKGDYIYKVQKTQVKAYNGAFSLFKWIDNALRCPSRDIMAYNFIDTVFEKTEGIK